MNIQDFRILERIGKNDKSWFIGQRLINGEWIKITPYINNLEAAQLLIDKYIKRIVAGKVHQYKPSSYIEHILIQLQEENL